MVVKCKELNRKKKQQDFFIQCSDSFRNIPNRKCYRKHKQISSTKENKEKKKERVIFSFNSLLKNSLCYQNFIHERKHEKFRHHSFPEIF